MDKIGLIINLLIAAAIASVVVIAIRICANAPIPLHDYMNTYEKTIEVSKSEDIEQAISNAVHDVKSRNFVVIYFSSYRCPAKKNFKVKCIGCDPASLLSQHHEGN